MVLTIYDYTPPIRCVMYGYFPCKLFTQHLRFQLLNTSNKRHFTRYTIHLNKHTPSSSQPNTSTPNSQPTHTDSNDTEKFEPPFKFSSLNKAFLFGAGVPKRTDEDPNQPPPTEEEMELARRLAWKAFAYATLINIFFVIVFILFMRYYYEIKTWKEFKQILEQFVKNQKEKPESIAKRLNSMIERISAFFGMKKNEPETSETAEKLKNILLRLSPKDEKGEHRRLSKEERKQIWNDILTNVKGDQLEKLSEEDRKKVLMSMTDEEFEQYKQKELAKLKKN